MRLSAYLTSLPFGSAAGEPCIEIHTDVPPTYEDAKSRLVQIWQQAAGLRGIACFWLPDAPFGQAGCDAGLLPMIEEIGTVRALVDVFSTTPTSLLVTQIVDATKLLGVGVVDPGELRAGLAARVMVPRSEEVIVRAIHPQNLTAAHLDAVSDFLVTAGVEPLGFVYVPEGLLEVAMVATAKASRAWRVALTAPAGPRVRLLEVRS